MTDRMMEKLDENECLRLIGSGGIGRIAYVGRFGPVGIRCRATSPR
jgi:hypothetical protein